MVSHFTSENAVILTGMGMILLHEMKTIDSFATTSGMHPDVRGGRFDEAV